MYERPVLATVRQRLMESRLFLQVVIGPRQVGKTTLLGQLVDGWRARPGMMARSVSADGVTTRGWLDQVWDDARRALAAERAVEGLLCIDEIQKIPGWRDIVTRNWDQDSRYQLPLKVVLGGSSRLLEDEGAGDSVFGRFEVHRLGHWMYRELRDAFGLTPERYAWFGAYPGTMGLLDDEPEFKRYVATSIIEASLNRDLFTLARIDNPALLRRLFEVGTMYSGQALSYTTLLEQVEAGNTVTLARYAHLLDEAGLLVALDKHPTTRDRVRASSPKFQTHNMALFSGLKQRLFGSVRADANAWPGVVAGAVGAHLLAELTADPWARLGYWRRSDTLVDFVMEGGERVLGIAVDEAGERGGVASLEAFRRAVPGASTLLIGPTGLDWRQFIAQPLADVLSGL